MTIMDMASYIPDDELDRIRKQVADLEATVPYNDLGEKIDWFGVLVREWWKNNEEKPNGWFQWWED